MGTKLKLILLVLVSTFIVWLPFLVGTSSLPLWGLNFSGGTKTIVANFDGPNYLIVAKSWYDKEFIRTHFSAPLPLEYYPAHLPLFPAVVSTFNYVVSGPWSLMLGTLLGSVLCVIMFYHFLLSKKIPHAFWLCTVFLILPARWLAVRSVGSPEPWFIFFILASIFYFNKKNFWLAGLFGALGQLTKSPGILLFAAYGIYWLWDSIQNKKINFRHYPLLLIPVSAVLLFYFYQLKTGDFWAYFHSGDNFHLFLPPFSIFSPRGQFWTGDFWLEEIIYVWLLYGYATFSLFKSNHRIEAIFSTIFFSTTLFVAHRDLSRYILPVAPFVILALEGVLQKKESKIIMALLVLPILLYTWNFMLNNVAPIADWTPYL